MTNMIALHDYHDDDQFNHICDRMDSKLDDYFSSGNRDGYEILKAIQYSMLSLQPLTRSELLTIKSLVNDYGCVEMIESILRKM